MRDLYIQAAILNYDRTEDSCRLALAMIQQGVPTHVVSTFASRDAGITVPTEVEIDEHAGESDWYGGKFFRGAERMLDRDAEILGFFACDCVVPDVAALVGRVRDVFERYPQVAVYMPDCHWSFWLCDRRFAPAIDKQQGLYETPALDSTCWFVRRPIAATLVAHKQSPHHGWGLERAAIWLCRRQGARWARDYHLRLGHPESHSYSGTDAQQTQDLYLATFGEEAVAWLDYMHRLGGEARQQTIQLRKSNEGKA